MQTLKLSTLLAFASVLLACSGEGLDNIGNENPGIGGASTGGDANCTPGDDACLPPGSGDTGDAPYNTGGGGSGGIGVGGTACWNWMEGCDGIGGAPYTGGTAGTGGWVETGGSAGSGGWLETGGTAGTGGSAPWVSYFDPAPPQPTDFSCCVIWAHCTHNPLDYRCTEATRKVTDSNRTDACDIWLEQVEYPIGSESIPYCL